MKLNIKGQGEINLSKSNFVGQGGQGQIFARGQTAYKLYTDPAAMMPAGKIQELSTLTNPNIINPQHIIVDKKGSPVGYTMRYVKDTYALCQLFTKAFKNRNNVSPQTSLDLVCRLREGVQHVHDHNILIVDLNEMNFLIDQSFKDIFFIDVDSYQTPHYPATAIMESIRDRHTAIHDFNEGSDWFSFAVISFQMMVGIHPYKGKHLTIKDMNDRMIQNISVLNSTVKTPKSCYPFDVVPEAYRRWYEAVLDRGQRIAPPDHPLASVTLPAIVRLVQSTDKLSIIELYEFQENILDLFSSSPAACTITTQGIHIKGSLVWPTTRSGVIGFTPITNRPIFVQTNGQNPITAIDIQSQKKLPALVQADSIMAYDGRIYLKTGTKILELVFTGSGTPIVSTLEVANILEHATQVWPGVIIQNLLGSTYVSVFPSSCEHRQLYVKELDGYRIVDAKYDHNVLMVVGEKNGKYNRFVIRFDDSYKIYDCRIEHNIQLTGLNFISLDFGICVCLNEEEKLEVFSSKMNSRTIKEISDPMLGHDMTLYKSNGKVLFARGNKMYQLSMV